MSGTNAVETQVNDPLLYAAPMPYVCRLHPLGFPLDLATNSRQVMDAANQSYAVYRSRFDRPPMRIHVIAAGDAAHGELPPEPSFRAQRHLLAIVSDQQNFAICDRQRLFSFCIAAPGTIADSLFFRWHFLEPAVWMMLEDNYVMTLHAACVARDGAGVLVAGASGMGKSTLAYACAKRGWTYVSDDSTSIVVGSDRLVVGDSHVFRFRAGAATLFPELRGLTVGRELNRKPTIEVRTADLPIDTNSECHVDAMVCLERSHGALARLLPIGKAEAWARLMPDATLTAPEWEAHQREVIESVLEVPKFVLQYSDYEEAVTLLEHVSQGKAA